MIKKTTALIALLACFSALWGQEAGVSGISFPSLIVSSNQQLIDSMARQSLVEVTRSYVLQRKSTGELLAAQGEDCFSKVTSLAIRVKGGLLVTKAAIAPWLYDRDFGEYQEEHDGVALGLSIVSDGKTIAAENVDAKCVAPKSEAIYFVATEDSADGFTVGHSSSEINGWAILFPDKSDTEMEPVTIKKKISVAPRTENYEMNKPKGVDKLKIGLYVEASFASIGTIEFKLCGMIVEDGDKLSIVIPESINASTPTSTTSKILVPVQDDPGKKRLKKGTKR